MGYLHSCLMCGEKIDSDLMECPHCGEMQYGENNEFYPDEKSMRAARAIMQDQSSGKVGFFRTPFWKETETTNVFKRRDFLIWHSSR